MQENQTGISTDKLRNATVHFTPTVASKFARFKSGWLQREEHPAIEGVQNTHHWSRRPQTSHQNWVGQAWSRRHCCSCASVVSTSFSLCEGGWSSFQALLLILTFEQLSVDIPVWFSCSCQLWRVRFNTWRSFNSQGKVVTLIRCGGLLLC